MKNYFANVIFLSLLCGAFSFLPALLVCLILGIDSSYAFIYSLIFCLVMMVVLPIPASIGYKREQKKIAAIIDQLGGKCYVWRVGIITNKSGAINGYFGFNGSCMRLIGKIKDKEYDVRLADDADAVIDFSQPPDIVVRTSKKKEYRIFSSQTAAMRHALDSLGWHIVEEHIEED